MFGPTYTVEYIWLDGTSPTQQLRSKIKVINIPREEATGRLLLKNIPMWNFDGSSTDQSSTSSSDLLLKPVYITKGRTSRSFDESNLHADCYVMCEVLNADGTPHHTNHRAKLRAVYSDFPNQEIRVGFEQEYFMRRGKHILGWESGTPRPQGDYYCAVGTNNIEGRRLMMRHLNACTDFGININGTNAEVALGQWEYQIGGPEVDALTACDELWVARYLLQRLGEEHNISIDLESNCLLW